MKETNDTIWTFCVALNSNVAWQYICDQCLLGARIWSLRWFGLTCASNSRLITWCCVAVQSEHCKWCYGLNTWENGGVTPLFLNVVTRWSGEFHRTWHGVDSWPPSSAEVKNVWSHNSSLIYDRNYRHFTWRRFHVYDDISLNSSQNEKYVG